MLSNHWIKFNAVYPWQVGYVACDEPSYDPWSLQVKPMNTPYIYMHHRRDENAGISTYQKGDIRVTHIKCLSHDGPIPGEAEMEVEGHAEKSQTGKLDPAHSLMSHDGDERV